jgi:pimeloyl-ACP methyl ester carboxylesterase
MVLPRSSAHNILVNARRPSDTAGPRVPGLLACALLALSGSAGATATEPVRHEVHMEGQGEGRATVIFENGLGDTFETWKDVQSAIAAHCARTVSYNRAGYPGSAPARGERDAATVVAELRSELQRRGIAPPYVLVGHSLGGLYMQYFARRYADEVTGLVLVDSTHWDQQLRMGASLPDPAKTRGTVMLFMPWIARREFTDSARAGEQVHASPHAQHVPTIVLSSTGALRGETPALRTEAARLQEDIVADFPGARHVRVDGSGHYIQADQPKVVIDSVRELAGCEAKS